MIEFINNIEDKYSNIYKRAENDVSNGATINQMIKIVNNRIKSLNQQTQMEIDRKNRKYDNPEEMYQLNMMKKKDQLLKQHLFKMQFKKNAKKLNQIKSYSPYITKLNETLRLKQLSFGQDIRYDNIYLHTFHHNETEPNKPLNKEDIFNIKVWPVKMKPKYSPKVYYIREIRSPRQDIKNYSPKYDFIYKRIPFVKIYPPHSKKITPIKKEISLKASYPYSNPESPRYNNESIKNTKSNQKKKHKKKILILKQ